MKVSLNWLKDYIEINNTPEEISEILTAIGLEVEGMEEVESVKGGLRGVVVGHVTACSQHPNADRLSLSKVDVGAEEELQIVCGAPNVAQGQKVLVATIGTVLYDKEDNDFKIKKGKIRGETSEGMICAEDELGLGESHDGIMVLPEDTTIGQLASDYFQLETDTVYEIGLTPNRSDATNHIGVAKDLAAALKINKQQKGEVKVPSVEVFKVDNNNGTLDVSVENTEACPRYAGVSIQGIKVGESPDWLKNRLNAIGVRPINNIVDITNFVLHEFGQPLHAFDQDKIKGRKIVVKTLPENTPFLSLDEVERKLSAEDLMICDGESNGMCIGGVFGGISSGVTDQTENIFLESAHFNARWIRRSSTRHLLRTDAAMCFEKGSDPNVSVLALKRAALLIQELAGGTIASEIVDIYPNKVEPNEVEVSYKNVSRLIGVDIPAEEVHAILEAMEMEIVSKNDSHFTVAVPTNKVDVTREADVIEEILRIYGFDRVPVSDQIRSAVIISDKPDRQDMRNEAAALLSARGYNEIMALSLTQSKYFEEVYPIPNEQLVFVNNTSNIHLDVMRPHMMIGGLEAVLHNQNRQNADLKLYEYGKTYIKAGDDFKEQEHLSIWLSGQQYAENWLNTEKKEVNYYSIKLMVNQLLQRFGLTKLQQTALKDGIFTYGMRLHRGEQTIVEFGKLKSTILKKIGIKKDVYYADFNWDAVMKALKKHKIGFEAITKYPSVRRDLALVIEKNIKFDAIEKVARKAGKKLLKAVNLFDVYENEEQLGLGKKSYAVSFTFEDKEKTLRDKDIDKIMQQLINQYEKDLGATIRR